MDSFHNMIRRRFFPKHHVRYLLPVLGVSWEETQQLQQLLHGVGVGLGVGWKFRSADGGHTNLGQMAIN
jgi:hypothetical protein